MLAPKRYLFQDLEAGLGVEDGGGGEEEEGDQVAPFSNFCPGRGKSPTSSLINPLGTERGTEEVWWKRGGLVENGNLFTFLFRGTVKGVLRKESSGSQTNKGLRVYLKG